MNPGDFVPPMLAMTAPRPFSREGWWYETKWDGFRAIVSVSSAFRVYSRRGHDLLARYPQLLQAKSQLGDDIVVDAELVGWVDGRPDFAALSAGHAPTYLLMVFDCLYRAGRWLLQEPLERRQAELRRQVSSGGLVVVPDGVTTLGERYFAAVAEMELEGVMAKRLDSPYLPGRRSHTWQKFVAYRTEWFWVTAQTPAADGSSYWHLAERVSGRLKPVGRARAPAGGRRPSDRLTPGFNQPFLVEVEYRERTREGRLRQARVRDPRKGRRSASGAYALPPSRN